jgi:hypothetical protein
MSLQVVFNVQHQNSRLIICPYMLPDFTTNKKQDLTETTGQNKVHNVYNRLPFSNYDAQICCQW